MSIKNYWKGIKRLRGAVSSIPKAKDKYNDTELIGLNFLDKSTFEKALYGVVEIFDIDKNLDLILKLHPEAKNVYIITDKTTTGEAINKKTNEIIANRSDKLNYINLQRKNMEEILETVKNPLKDSVILFLVFFEDESGNKFTYSEIQVISINSINILRIELLLPN